MPLSKERLDQFDAFARTMLFVARGDGETHPAERAAIVEEFGRELAELDFENSLSDEDAAALADRLKRIRTSRTSLEVALDTLLKDPRTRLQIGARDRLPEAARRVIEAKGDPWLEEIQYLEWFRDRMTW